MINNIKSSFEEMPKTGRVGRLIKILHTEILEELFLEILENACNYELLKDDEKSAWWKNTIEKMENKLGIEKAIHVMKLCGSKCCGKGQRATARRLYIESGSIQDFLKKISKHDVKEGELNYILEDENTIIAEHNKCFCKQVANTKKQFNSLIYCQCSVEFNKQFFTAALGKEVKVEILQSIICGAESCKFKIII